MKRILFLALLVCGAAATSFAQCDTKLTFSASKTEHLENGSVLRTEEENTVLQIDKSFITLSINGEEKGVMTVKSQTCNWTVPFKEGKSTFNATMGEGTFSLTIEGKDGKIYLTAKNEGGDGNPIRLLANKFEEVK